MRAATSCIDILPSHKLIVRCCMHGLGYRMSASLSAICPIDLSSKHSLHARTSNANASLACRDSTSGLTLASPSSFFHMIRSSCPTSLPVEGQSLVRTSSDEQFVPVLIVSTHVPIHQTSTSISPRTRSLVKPLNSPKALLTLRLRRDTLPSLKRPDLRLPVMRPITKVSQPNPQSHTKRPFPPKNQETYPLSKNSPLQFQLKFITQLACPVRFATCSPDAVS